MQFSAVRIIIATKLIFLIAAKICLICVLEMLGNISEGGGVVEDCL